MCNGQVTLSPLEIVKNKKCTNFFRQLNDLAGSQLLELFIKKAIKFPEKTGQRLLTLIIMPHRDYKYFYVSFSQS